MEASLLTAYIALGIFAVIPIYFGARASLHYPEDHKRKGSKKSESLSSEDAYMFPIMGSGVLFGLYLMFTYFNKDYINYLLTAYFSVLGVTALTKTGEDILHALLPSSWLPEPYLLTLQRRKQNMIDYQFDYYTVFAFVCAVLGTVYYAITKNWIASNVFGEAFATSAVSLLALDSFKTGMILLSGLFFYDVFWVFGTPVMVTVAKSFDAPIKVLFPKDLFADQTQFTMLGLGDIVIPGIFVALCLRFDQHLAKDKHHFSKPYFTTCFIAYVLGLVTTVVVMHTYQAAQPALLYLSPACILSVLGLAAVRGELKELFAFSEQEDEKAVAAKAKKPKRASSAASTASGADVTASETDEAASDVSKKSTKTPRRTKAAAKDLLSDSDTASSTGRKKRA